MGVKYIIPKGYPSVRLAKDAQAKTHAVHRLVLGAFVGPAPIGHQGAHLNGNKTDNRLDNLAWVTPQVNNGDHRRQHGKIISGENHCDAKLTDEAVRWIRRNGKGRERGYIKRMAREYGVAQSTMQAVVSGKTWKHVI